MIRKMLLIMAVLGIFWGIARADEGLLSQNEYGKNLYENPRGIACNKCHGNNGEGSIIARYKHKGVEKTLLAPRINNIEFSIFQRALRKQKGVMPVYYLTDEEITAIYMYLYRP